MAYTPTTWATGDIVTASKLNNMESGIVASDYDLVIKIECASGTNPTYQDCSVISGTIAAFEQKALDKEIATGIAVIYKSFNSAVTDYIVCPIEEITIGYRTLYFNDPNHGYALHYTSGYEFDDLDIS